MEVFNLFIAGMCLATAINCFTNGRIFMGFLGLIICVFNVLGYIKYRK